MMKTFDAGKKIRYFGYRPSLSRHERKNLGIFNLMNFAFGLMLGVLIPFMSWLSGNHFPVYIWSCLYSAPLFITIGTAVLVKLNKYERAKIFFFILHPVSLTLIYSLKVDIGTDLFFICFGVLSVFFLENVYYIIFSFALSTSCYFIAHSFSVEPGLGFEGNNFNLFLFNRLMAIVFVFHGIFWIRQENDRYQLQIVKKNLRLNGSNLKITAQQKELSKRAATMEEQSKQLTELNSLKNKLFSVIVHDLRGPFHALHVFFRNMIRFDLPADEIKILIPDVVKDLGETTDNIENLLQWAKCQMQAETIEPQLLDISEIIGDVLKFLRLQLEAKKQIVEKRVDGPIYVFADKEMIILVLRNLLSNAIKFSAEHGTIVLGANEYYSHVRIFVRDAGVGISAQTLKKLEENIQYSTVGTAQEPGTGLGLMLCKEFLSRNGGRLEFESEEGKGSIFSFTLPKE